MEGPVALNTLSLNVLRYYLNSGSPQLVSLRCSGEPPRGAYAMSSLWYLYIADKPLRRDVVE